MTATDANSDTLEYSLEGTDAASFDIDSTSGQIQTKSGVTYDHEAKDSYSVTVKADDDNGGSDTVPVTITVTDVTEKPALTGYEVQYRKGTGGSWTDWTHSGTGTTATITPLDASSAYQVQVRALKWETPSEWSPSGTGTTGAPLRVQMTPDLPPPVEGAFSLRFSFSETVTDFTLAGITTTQDPAYTDSGNNPVSFNPTIAALQTTDDRIFTTTVTPHTEGVNHNYTLTITVPANTVTSVVDNKPNEAAAIAVRVAPPGVTVPISSIGRTASPDNGQVTLRWNAPQNTGGALIVRYEYRWGESGGEFGDWMRVDSSERSATVRNLTNGREYVFEVRGVNALGYGGVETVQATPSRPTGGGGFGGGGGSGGVRQTVPSAPRNLRAGGGDEQVALSWQAPENDGGSEIRDYQYRINGRNPWTTIGSTDTTHTVTGPDNGTVYVFEVRAVNRIGRGRASNRVEATPRAPVTLLVANFSNGNNGASNSRVYLWNPSTSAGQVTARVFTLPLTTGIAQELTSPPLDLGTLKHDRHSTSNWSKISSSLWESHCPIRPTGVT